MLSLATVFAAPGSAFVVAAVAVAALMLVTWAIATAIEDVSIIDVVWGLAFVVVALAGALAGDGDSGRRLLLLGLVGIWGLRLAGYIGWRKSREAGEDRRYQVMREREGDRFVLWSLTRIFFTQGTLALVISLPISVAADRPGELDALIVPGVILWAIGVFFETVGDAQLAAFKANPDNKGQVMDRGLWRYTRHPNYFGDFCVWWGLWLVVLPAGGTWWTAIGPAIMTILLTRVSGKDLLEKDIGSRRPGYKEYVERTSGFFPMPPRG